MIIQQIKNSIDFALMSSMVKECGKRTISKYGFVEKKILKNATDYNMEKVKKWSNIRLIKRKLVMNVYKQKHMYRTINLYVFGKMKQKDNWIVFESFVGRNYSGQPKYIYRYLQKNYGSKFKYIWVVNDKNLVIDGNCKKIKRFGLKYYYYMTRSKYWVNNMRQPLSIPRREETVMLATWHGTPLKRLVFDMDDVHSANPRYKDIVFKQTRAWIICYLTILFQQKDSRAVSDLKKKRFWNTDILLMTQCMHLTEKSRQQRLKRNLEFQRIRKLILYAPTWRDDQSTKQDSMVLNLILMLTDFRKSLGMNMYCY